MKPHSHTNKHISHVTNLARVLWLIGDWQNLIKLENDNILNTSDYSEVRILIAAAHLQMSCDMNNIKDIILDLNTNKENEVLIKKVLIAGVFNILGRASALENQQAKAFKFFEKSIALMLPEGDFHKKVIKSRFYEQLSSLELFDSNNICIDNKLSRDIRWLGTNNLQKNWNSRTKFIAGFIQPGEKVIEFGAGNMLLKDIIPKDCKYTPSDLYDRGGDNMLVLDLNGFLYPRIESYDVAVFSGVLEYVINIPRLINYVFQYANRIIASYAIFDLNKDNRQDWVNSYTEEQFIEIFLNAGYRCTSRNSWRRQVVFEFSI